MYPRWCFVGSLEYLHSYLSKFKYSELVSSIRRSATTFTTHSEGVAVLRALYNQFATSLFLLFSNHSACRSCNNPIVFQIRASFSTSTSCGRRCPSDTFTSRLLRTITCTIHVLLFTQPYCVQLHIVTYRSLVGL
jgi:hypothetical protein